MIDFNSVVCTYDSNNFHIYHTPEVSHWFICRGGVMGGGES